MIDIKKIGKYISEQRKEYLLTQQELAEKLNVSFQAVSKWENGISMPSVEILPELAEIFNITVDELLSAKDYFDENTDEIHEFYDAGQEIGRLEHGLGIVEFERTKEIISRYLSNKPLKIYDIGGGIGIYSSWLSSLGHDVSLLDFSEKSIEYAKRTNNRMFKAEVCDARNLNKPDNSADMVLLMGPLYHLQSRTDRIKVLKEAKRVLNRDGILICSGISKFSSTSYAVSTYGKENNFLDDKIYCDMLEREIDSGLHIRPKEYPFVISQSYFHTVREMQSEISSVGFVILNKLAVEGIVWFTPLLDEKWNDINSKEKLKWIIEKTETEDEIIGMSPHFMIISKK